MTAQTATTSPAYGEVFTRRWVVETILDLVGYTPDQPLHSLTLVEPSVGSGAFLGPVVERLIESATAHGVDLGSLGHALRGYDLQKEHVATCQSLARQLLVHAGLAETHADTLVAQWLRPADYLLDGESLAADFVVGNPPYIRSDDLDDVTEAAYRTLWPTMRGRADIYVGFFERSLSILKPGGKVGFICADRWTRNAYGSRLRGLISDYYSVDAHWQMHDVDAFEAEVSAYPAITVLSRKAQGAVVVAEMLGSFGEADAREVLAFARSDLERVRTKHFVAHRSPSWFKGTDLWPAGDPDRVALLELLNEKFRPLEDTVTGTKIGIGVATGADKAYVVDQSVDVEVDRKLPMIMTDDVRSGRFSWGGKVLLNPWTDEGQLVDLERYPKLRRALEAHPALRDRYVARKNQAGWFRTIDKVNASLTTRPKLVLQDMKATIQPVLEEGGHYPHHNLYYVVSDKWDLRVLGGLLLSRVAQAFIEAYGVRMRGGTLRFQAQYLRKIRVPDPDGIAMDVRSALSAAFDARDSDAATDAALRAYGLKKGSL